MTFELNDNAIKIKSGYEADDGFEFFPEGATFFDRETLFRRMDERKEKECPQRIEVNEEIIENENNLVSHDSKGNKQLVHHDSFDDFMDTVEPLQIESHLVQSVDHDGNAFVTSVIEALWNAMNANSIANVTGTISHTEADTTISFKIKKSPMKPVNQENSQAHIRERSTSSSVVRSMPRKRRIITSDGQQEEDENLPNDASEIVEANQETPKKKASPKDSGTPSPANKMSQLNLSDEDSQDLEKDDVEPDDSQDPDWIPDSQDNRDRPEDWVIPMSAARDPIDLDY